MADPGFAIDPNCPADPGYGGYAVSYGYDNYPGDVDTAHSWGRRRVMWVGDWPNTTNKQEYQYDARGRVVTETVWLDGTSYTTSYIYNRQDRVVTTTYPDGEVVTTTYDAAGRPFQLSSSLGTTYVITATYTPEGRPDTLDLGNGLQVNRDCYGWEALHGQGRLQTIQAGSISDPTSLQEGWYPVLAAYRPPGLHQRGVRHHDRPDPNPALLPLGQRPKWRHTNGPPLHRSALGCYNWPVRLPSKILRYGAGAVHPTGYDRARAWETPGPQPVWLCSEQPPGLQRPVRACSAARGFPQWEVGLPSWAQSGLMRRALSVGCFFLSCHVDAERGVLRGPTPEEQITTAIQPMPMSVAGGVAGNLVDDAVNLARRLGLRNEN